MTPLLLFDPVDMFAPKTKCHHHIEVQERGTDHSQIWFTVRRPRGGMTCLVLDEKLHGRERMLHILEWVTSHTMWHHYAIEEIEERGADHPVTLATLGMVDIRHAGLPIDLQPV